jgi:UDP-galactopyranose mutase
MPMIFPLTANIAAELIVYDCMDELSAFKFADQRLAEAENSLLAKADIVFTGGLSLYDSRRSRHHNCYLFPSSVDYDHFAEARSSSLSEPADQINLTGPRLGYLGVIDERLDMALIREIAAMCPNWSFIMIGPVVKISPDSLPQAGNLHWLGTRNYDKLPFYLSGWQVALMPFSLNEATRYIIRKQHGFDENDIVIGWLDAKKRVENFIDAAAISSP